MPFQFVIPYIIISVYCVLKPVIIDVLATVFICAFSSNLGFTF